MATTVVRMVSRIGPNAPILLLVDHFGPIRDTIKSLKVNRIPALETVPWTPICELGEQCTGLSIYSQNNNIALESLIPG